MADNQIYKQSDDKTPFAPLLSSPTDPNPWQTLSGSDQKVSGTPWQSYANQRARKQADEITAKEQGSKASRLAASKKKRKGSPER